MNTRMYIVLIFRSINSSKITLKCNLHASSLSVDIIAKLFNLSWFLVNIRQFFIGFSLEKDLFPEATLTGNVKNTSQFQKLFSSVWWNHGVLSNPGPDSAQSFQPPFIRLKQRFTQNKVSLFVNILHQCRKCKKYN